MPMMKLGLSKGDLRKTQELPFARIVSAYLAVMADNPSSDESREGFAPVMDGKNVPQHPFDPAASPVMADVPLMVGSNRTEMTVFSMREPANFTLDDVGLRSRIGTLVGDQAEAVLEVYRRVNPTATPSDLFFLIDSDYRYTGPAMKIAERRAALAKAPVHSYFFTWETPVENGKLKSPHSLEVPFVFDNVQISSRMTGGGADAMALADRISDAWIAFARMGEPNTSKLPKWPQYDTQDRYTIVLDNASRAEKDPIRQQRMAIQRALGLG
jgi:para-nitrobenzyl esterase